MVEIYAMCFKVVTLKGWSAPLSLPLSPPPDPRPVPPPTPPVPAHPPTAPLASRKRQRSRSTTMEMKTSKSSKALVTSTSSLEKKREERRYEIHSIQTSWFVVFFRVWWLGYKRPTQEPRQSLLENGVSTLLGETDVCMPQASPKTLDTTPCSRIR